MRRDTEVRTPRSPYTLIQYHAHRIDTVLGTTLQGIPRRAGATVSISIIR